MQALSRGVMAYFAQYDALLTPALAERPLELGEMHDQGEDDGDFARAGQFTPFTALLNVTGQPAISLPAGFGDDGLPTCAQLVGKPAGEGTLLQLAAQLEAARPPRPRRPRDGRRLGAEHRGERAAGGRRAPRRPRSRAASHRHPISSASSQVANAAGPASAS